MKRIFAFAPNHLRQELIESFRKISYEHIAPQHNVDRLKFWIYTVCERRSFTDFKNARCYSIDFLLGCLAGAEQIDTSAWHFLNQEIPKLIRTDDQAWVHLRDYRQLSEEVMNGFRKTIWEACTQEFEGSLRGQQRTMDLTVSPQQTPRKLLNFITDFENLDLPPASYQGSTGLAEFHDDETPNLQRASQMERSLLSGSTHGSDSTFHDPEQANDPFAASIVPSTQPHAAQTGEQAFFSGEAQAMQQELNTLRENEGKVRAQRTSLDNRAHAIEEQQQELSQKTSALDRRTELVAQAVQAEREGLLETIEAEREILARDTEKLHEQFRQVEDERQQQIAVSQRLSELSEQQRSRSAEANQALAAEKQNLLAFSNQQEQVASRQVERELAQDAREQDLEQRELAVIPESEVLQVPRRSPPPRQQAAPGRHTPVGIIPSTPQQGIILAEKLTPQHVTTSELRRRFPSPEVPRLDLTPTARELHPSPEAPRLDFTPVPQRVVGGHTALPTPLRTPHRRESLSPGSSEFSTIAPDSPSDSPIERPPDMNIAQGLALELDQQDLADILKTPSKFHGIVSALTEETGRQIDPTKLTDDIVAELQRPSREYTAAVTPPQGYGGPAGGEVGTPQQPPSRYWEALQELATGLNDYQVTKILEDREYRTEIMEKHLKMSANMEEHLIKALEERSRTSVQRGQTQRASPQQGWLQRLGQNFWHMVGGTPTQPREVRSAIVPTPPNLPARSALVLLNRGRTPITEDSPRQGPMIGADFYQRLEKPATPQQRQQAQMLDTGAMRAALGTEEYERKVAEPARKRVAADVEGTHLDFGPSRVSQSFSQLCDELKDLLKKIGRDSSDPSNTSSLAQKAKLLAENGDSHAHSRLQELLHQVIPGQAIESHVLSQLKDLIYDICRSSEQEASYIGAYKETSQIDDEFEVGMNPRGTFARKSPKFESDLERQNYENWLPMMRVTESRNLGHLRDSVEAANEYRKMGKEMRSYEKKHRFSQHIVPTVRKNITKEDRPGQLKDLGRLSRYFDYKKQLNSAKLEQLSENIDGERIEFQALKADISRLKNQSLDTEEAVAALADSPHRQQHEQQTLRRIQREMSSKRNQFSEKEYQISLQHTDMLELQEQLDNDEVLLQTNQQNYSYLEAAILEDAELQKGHGHIQKGLHNIHKEAFHTPSEPSEFEFQVPVTVTQKEITRAQRAPKKVQRDLARSEKAFERAKNKSADLESTVTNFRMLEFTGTENERILRKTLDNSLSDVSRTTGVTARQMTEILGILRQILPKNTQFQQNKLISNDITFQPKAVSALRQVISHLRDGTFSNDDIYQVYIYLQQPKAVVSTFHNRYSKLVEQSKLIHSNLLKKTQTYDKYKQLNETISVAPGRRMQYLGQKTKPRKKPMRVSVRKPRAKPAKRDPRQKLDFGGAGPQYMTDEHNF